jgi:hypothetical protein
VRTGRNIKERYDQLFDRYRDAYRAYEVEYRLNEELLARLSRNKVVILVLPFLSAVFAASFVAMAFLAGGQCG